MSRMIARFIPLIAVLGAYVLFYLYRYLRLFLPRAAVIPAVCLLAAFLACVPLWFVLRGTRASRLVTVLGAYAMGVFVYLLLYTLAFGLLQLIARIFVHDPVKMRTARLILGSACVGLTIVTCAWGFWNAAHPRVVKYRQESIGDLRIVLISDVHLGEVGSEERLERIVDTVNGCDADIVCIAGDIFSSGYSAVNDPERAMRLMGQLRARYGVYACPGNHDGGEGYDKMTEFLADSGVTLLRDEGVVIDGRYALFGRRDASSIGRADGVRRQDITDRLHAAAESGLTVIVMDHNPTHIDEYDESVKLVLSGHTHRGQIFPASLVTARVYKEDYGYYVSDRGVHQVISCGVGTWGLPMRTGSCSEVALIGAGF